MLSLDLLFFRCLYSDTFVSRLGSCLTRVSMDPRVTPVGDDRKKNVNADYYRIDFVYKKYAPDEVRRILNNYM